jgi:hypothetical protein
MCPLPSLNPLTNYLHCMFLLVVLSLIPQLQFNALVIVGEEEEKSNTVMFRSGDAKTEVRISLADFVAACQESSLQRELAPFPTKIIEFAAQASVAGSTAEKTAEE